MSQLYAGNRAVLLYKTGDLFEEGDMLIFPDTKVIRRNSAFRRYRGSLCENQARAANRPGAKMHQVPFVGKAVNAGILTHRGNDQPVLKGDIPYGNRFKK
jgi:hypothetical protein